MIEINLLPDDLRKGKRAKRARKAPGSGIQAFVIFLILLLLGATAGGAAFQFLPFFEKDKNYCGQKDRSRETASQSR